MSSPDCVPKVTPLPNQQVFNAWASVYDEQLNPLLALEQRFLVQLLPNVRERDVLDAGCGTGRWLRLLSEQSPRSLIGIDPSSDMLHHASAKCIAGVELRLGSCTDVPLPDASVDVVLLSFVLSYVPDIKALVQELIRISRPGAHIFITDMHPETATALRWKRAFRQGKERQELQTCGRSLDELTDSFQASGFLVRAMLEPRFGPSEKIIFDEAGKLEAYQATAHLPAIYIAHIQKPATVSIPSVAASLYLTGASCAIGSNESLSASIAIEDGNIVSISNRPTLHQKQFSSATDAIDLTGYMLLPGLINAHDHLEFGLFPNLGRGPYENALSWANDIHDTCADTIALYNSVPKTVRLWWGGIRNLLCGVTTVCHHNPVTPELLDNTFPIRVVSNFGWAHSVYIDEQFAEKFRSTPANTAFIIHAAEGIDQQSADEIFQLDRALVLDEHTALVHGLALTAEGVALLNQKRAALILCPTSNQFLFDRLPDSELLHPIKNIALGSDSPLTAKGDLLDELRIAYSQIGLGTDLLYNMVTTKPAAILRLQNGEGRLAPDARADIIAVRDTGLSPAETLSALTFNRIELVLLAGRIQLASSSIYEHLSPKLQHGLQLLEVDGHVRWIRAPLHTLFAETTKILGNHLLSLGGKEIQPMKDIKGAYLPDKRYNSLTYS